MQEQNNLKYLQIDSDILTKTSVVLPDGTKEILGMFERMLYCYLKAKYDYFHSNNQDMIESQETINNYFSFVSLKTIQRACKTLERCGMIAVTRKTNHRSNKFTVYPANMCDGKPKKNTRMLRYKSPEKKPIEDTTQTIPAQVEHKFYLQYWFSPFFECLKFGISQDVQARQSKQHTTSMFAHTLIETWDIPSKQYGLNLEREIKKNFEHSGCLKVWAPDGFSETISVDDKESVKIFIEKYINDNKIT